jgi:hypothetical protein
MERCCPSTPPHERFASPASHVGSAKRRPHEGEASPVKPFTLSPATTAGERFLHEILNELKGGRATPSQGSLAATSPSVFSPRTRRLAAPSPKENDFRSPPRDVLCAVSARRVAQQRFFSQLLQDQSAPSTPTGDASPGRKRPALGLPASKRRGVCPPPMAPMFTTLALLTAEDMSARNSTDDGKREINAAELTKPGSPSFLRALDSSTNSLHSMELTSNASSDRLAAVAARSPCRAASRRRGPHPAACRGAPRPPRADPTLCLT